MRKRNLASPCALPLSLGSQPTTKDETVVAGSKVILRCQVEDPQESYLQWSNPTQQTLYFGEKRALRDNRIQLEKSTSYELTISIDNVSLADEGEYTCSIFTMPVRTAKAVVTVLGVPRKPQIFGYREPLKDGQTAKLRCVSSGSKPPARLEWQKGGTSLSGKDFEVTEDSNGKTFTVSSHVEFVVSKEDNGVDVTCMVRHPSLPNSASSTTLKIEVFYVPIASIQPDPTYPREGEILKLECDGQGNPVPQEFIWRKEGVLTPLAETQDKVLLFPSLNKSDSGTYICSATNIMGTSEARYNLAVNGFRPLFK
uniref:Cell adhesion molecule 3 n=1 Tax=Sphaerodactylus townsendi TaxID=933632 RepID=A0ACB8G879_9SAUR